MGVSFMKVGDEDKVVAVARSTAAAMAALESVEIPVTQQDTEAADDTVTEVEEV
jgi:hypothetical protein